MTRDTRDVDNVNSDHAYTHYISDESDSEVEEESARLPEPVLDVNIPNIFFDGDIAGELCVAQQETVGGDDDEVGSVDSDEVEYVDFDSEEEALVGESEQDSSFVCDSQHSTAESSYSQECSQISEKG